MKQRLLLAACATVLIAACSDRGETGSDNPTAPGIVAFDHQDEPHVCNYRLAKSYAQSYFELSRDRNAARNALTAAEAAADTDARNEALFDVLELVAQVGGDPAKSDDPADGAALVGEVVDCGDWKMSDGRGFPAVTANALTDGQGAFAVVGAETFGDANAEWVETEDGVFAFGFNDYNSLADSWEATFGRAVVILANVGSQPFGLPTRFGLGYRVNLIFAEVPNDWGDDQLAAEFCSTDDVDLTAIPGIHAQHRVGRQSSNGDAALQQGNITGFCPEHNAPPSEESSTASARPSLLARMVDQVIGFFRPAPLQAMMFVPPWSGSSGGQGTSFDDGGFYSDYFITDVETVHMTVPFVPDQNINTDFDPTLSITVCGRAATANQVPACGQPGDVDLENATVTITVIGNFGTPITLSCGDTDPADPGPGNLSCSTQTDEDGVAAFKVQLNKTGSYTFEVKTEFDDRNLTTSTNQFIVRP